MNKTQIQKLGNKAIEETSAPITDEVYTARQVQKIVDKLKNAQTQRLASLLRAL